MTATRWRRCTFSRTCQAHRPPFNLRLRDDNSFPPSRHVEDGIRAYVTPATGPVNPLLRADANAKQGARDSRLNRAFRFGVRGPKPGRHSASLPRLPIERCHAPCVIPHEGGIREIIEASSLPGRRPRRSSGSPAAEPRRRRGSFEDAARYRIAFTRSRLADRQLPIAVRRLDRRIGVRRRGTAGGQLFRSAGGKMLDRRFPPRERGDRRDRRF